MSIHSSQKKKRRESQVKFKSIGNHEEFLERITKTLYYAELPSTERFSLPLSELAVELYSEVKIGKSLERLTIEDASEISRNACISPCSLVLAMLYLEQLKTTNPVYIDKVTPSDLFVVSLMVASKFLNDSGEEDDVMNSEWATSAGISLSDINKLEKEFLKAIDWKVFIKDSEFWKKLRSVETKVALHEGKKRGWYSYTDLEALLDQINAYLLARALITVSAVCLASYAAGMLTVIGSTMVATQFLYVPLHHHTLWNEIAIESPKTNHTHSYETSGEFFRNDYLQNRSQYDCQMFDYTLENSCSKIGIKDTSTVSTKNITAFYDNFLVPISYNLIRFSQNWKQPQIQILSQ
uniref:Protein CNPPD1 n=1 Tax=Riptortus pedestris TaxID=329032 RepID=R4WCY2_RIPPE|nr:conserved hypothetical protein [Riptortus pedestris]